MVHGLYQTTEFRTRILSRLLQTIARVTETTSGFQTLSIVGVGNHNYGELVTQLHFYSVFQRLRSLKLNFVTEQLSWNITGQPHVFFGPFTSAWFAPVMPNLTSLALLSESYWGYWPKVNLSQLFFPQLQVLALGKYTFGHDWQLKWITKHGKSFKSYISTTAPLSSTYAYSMTSMKTDTPSAKDFQILGSQRGKEHIALPGQSTLKK